MDELLPSNLKVIAIQNYGPSGTLLLHSLLDGHPEVIQLPGLTGIHVLQTINNKLNQENLRAADLAGVMLSVYEPLYSIDHLSLDHGLRFLGPECDQHPCVDREQFQDNYITYVKYLMMREKLPAEIESGQENKYLRVFFHAIYAAYAKGLGEDPAIKKVLVYPIHSGHPDQAIRLQDMFEECVFIHMIRHPLNMMDSNIKYLQYSQKYHLSHLNIFKCGISVILQDQAPQVKFLYRMRSIYKYDRLEDASKVEEFSVQLEKLHTRPEETMAEIATRCGIEWSDSLLDSTFGGKQWWNRPGLKKVSGFNRQMKIKQKLKYFPAFDQWRLSVLVGPLLEGLGYDKDRSKFVTKIRRFAAYFLCALPFRLERITMDGVRGIILTNRKKAEAGNKQAKNITAVAKAYWDARRRTSLFQLPVIDKEEEEKPGNQRVIVVYRDSEDNVCSTQYEFDTKLVHVSSGVLQDYDDPLIPRLTNFKKAKAAIHLYLSEYVENRRNLWEAHREIVKRQDEMIYPISDSKA